MRRAAARISVGTCCKERKEGAENMPRASHAPASYSAAYAGRHAARRVHRCKSGRKCGEAARLRALHASPRGRRSLVRTRTSRDTRPCIRVVQALHERRSGARSAGASSRLHTHEVAATRVTLSSPPDSNLRGRDPRARASSCDGEGRSASARRVATGGWPSPSRGSPRPDARRSARPKVPGTPS
jgi:hypothetical protein